MELELVRKWFQYSFRHGIRGRLKKRTRLHTPVGMGFER